MTTMMKNEIEAQASLLPVLQPILAEAADALPRAAGRILMGGCGDSAFAPDALFGVFRALGLEIEPRTSMQLTHFTRVGDDDMVVLSSISGGTKRTVDAALAARRQGARVIAVTCNGASALANAADATLVLPFTPLSRKTPHTLDYGVTLLALAEIARSQAGMPSSTLAAALAGLPARLARASADSSPLSDAYKAGGKTFFLGSGGDRGTADYAAAKFHEAGGLFAISAETENFVHGMNFMLERDDILVAIASSAAAAKRTREVLEAFAPLATVFPISSTVDTGVEEVSGTAAAAALGLLLDQTLTVQFMCLQVAERLGLHLEEPRAGNADGREHMAAQTAVMAN